MTRLQFILIGSAVLLFFGLYFGCNTKPPKQAAIEKSRALAAESTDLNALLQEAKSSIPAAQLSPVLVLDEQLRQTTDDSTRAELLKELSGQWYDLGQPAISGTYAQGVAEILGTEESWSITGTTFTICLQRSEEPKIRSYCFQRAVNAFESAISINPGNIAHKVNLALCYVENPPEDQPMRGITLLLELNQMFPEEVVVLNALARLALKTGQFDRAIERLEQARNLEPENRTTNCLLAQAYEGAGDIENARRFEERCQALGG